MNKSDGWGTNLPLAVKGLISYRYRGTFGWIMIGAKSDKEALREAERSHGAPTVLENLQVWNGTAYEKVKPC